MLYSNYSDNEQSGYFSLSENLLVLFPTRWTHAAMVSYLPKAVGYLNVLLIYMCQCVYMYMNICMCANIIYNSRFIVVSTKTQGLFLCYCLFITVFSST